MKPVEISKIVRTCVRFEFLGNNVFLNFVDEPVIDIKVIKEGILKEISSVEFQEDLVIFQRAGFEAWEPTYNILLIDKPHSLSLQEFEWNHEVSLEEHTATIKKMLDVLFDSYKLTHTKDGYFLEEIQNGTL